MLHAGNHEDQVLLVRNVCEYLNNLAMLSRQVEVLNSRNCARLPLSTVPRQAQETRRTLVAPTICRGDTSSSPTLNKRVSCPPSRSLAMSSFPSSSADSSSSLPPLLAPSRRLFLLPPPPLSHSHSRSAPALLRAAALPDEVLLSIFERLQHARDIAAARGVCSSWRHLIDRTHTIWRHLVFDLPRCPSTAPYAETWYRKAADYGNAQAQVRSRLSALLTALLSSSHLLNASKHLTLLTPRFVFSVSACSSIHIRLFCPAATNAVLSPPRAVTPCKIYYSSLYNYIYTPCFRALTIESN